MSTPVCLRRMRAALLACLLFVGGVSAAEKMARLNGVVYTLGPDQVQTVWPNARVTLKSLTTQSEMATVTDHLGAYSFTGVIPGPYEVTVKLAGFETVTKPVTLEADGAAQVSFRLLPEKQVATIEVREDAAGIDLTSSSAVSPVLTASFLKSAATLSDDFQNLLPLLPGVVRGPDGLIRIKGGRTNQSNTLANTSSIADPFTGQPALRLPAVAVESVQVLSNPFSAKYGRFGSGVVDVNTRGGTNRWKWLFENPIPRFRWIDGSTHGIESTKPHLVFSGPLKKERLYLFQSTFYRYEAIRTYSLPEPDNVRVEEMFNTHTQLDWIVTPSQRLTALLTVDPQEIAFANIDTFNPQPAAASYKHRGFFASAVHRWILANGGYIQSAFSAKRFDPRVYPSSQSTAAAMTLFPEQNSGAFYQRQDRRTRLYQWSQSFHRRPVVSSGRHLLTLGYAYARATYRGIVSNLPVTVLREDGTRSREITYSTPAAAELDRHDVAVFVQDNWQIHPRLTLDLGVRADSDSLSRQMLNLAPRIGFVFAPTRDNRTALRGGFGVFFDKIPMNVALFREFPAQTVTRYAADGVIIADGPRTFTHTVGTASGRLRVSYSLGWTVQLDRELRPGLLFRFGYEHRRNYRDFYIEPVELATGTAELRLMNSGRQEYRELLWMLRWQPLERTSFYASYVHSSTRGELNDYNQFFGNFGYPLIRPNQRGRLGHDTPNRALFWGVVGLPWKLEFVPVLDVHSGFPFSAVDADWEYAGRRNGAGRFPTFAGLDMKLQYPFNFKFWRWRFRFRAGLKVINVLNHFNPRDVQQSLDSPQFGQFFNSVRRLYRIEGGFDF